MPRTALLIHGLGATHHVWGEVATQLRQRYAEVRCPDLPGHGAADPLPSYSIGQLASLLAQDLAAGDVHGPIDVIGHSLGGVVALALASGWFGVEVATTVALGVKVRWEGPDADRAEGMSLRPPRVLPTDAEAAVWAAKLAGLPGPDAVPGFGAAAIAPTSEGEQGWRAVWDPRTASLHSPPMAQLLAAARGDVVLARGSDDHMNTDEDLASLRSDAVTIPDAGHNAHVDAPDAVAALLG